MLLSRSQTDCSHMPREMNLGVALMHSISSNYQAAKGLCMGASLLLQSDTFTFTIRVVPSNLIATIVTLLHHMMRKVTFQSKRGHSRVLRTGCLHQNICRTTSPWCWSWGWRSPGSGGKQRQDVTRHTSWVTGNSYKHSTECLIIHITLANYNTWL